MTQTVNQTTIRVSTSSRDALTRIAAERSESLESAIKRLVWEHECRASMERLQADPEAWADYVAETDMLGNAATEVVE